MGQLGLSGNFEFHASLCIQQTSEAESLARPKSSIPKKVHSGRGSNRAKFSDLISILSTWKIIWLIEVVHYRVNDNLIKYNSIEQFHLISSESHFCCSQFL